MEVIKFSIHTLILFTLIAYTAISFCGTIEDIQNQLKQNTPAKEIKSNSVYDVQDIYKSKVSGWTWDKGSGNKILLAVNVKFRIKQKGENIKIPHLCVYLFDREKNIAEKIERYFFLTAAGTTKKSDTDLFKGNQTYLLQFPYSIDDKFHYIIAVVGDDNSCSYSILPKGNSLDDFEFQEKHFIK